jgi:hypothetical protein
VGHVLRAVASASAVCAVLLAYPVAIELFGRLHPVAPVHGTLAANPYVGDLLSPVIPNSLVLAAPHAVAAMADRFTGGGLAEAGGYLGIPLLALVAFCVWHFRRRRAIVVFGCIALFAEVLSLGPSLIVDGHDTHVPLPWDLLGRLPEMVNVLPVRFSLYVVIFVAAILALSIRYTLDEPMKVPADHRHRLYRQSMASVLVAAAAVSLVPRWPISSEPTSALTPRFFTSRDAAVIPLNAIVLTYPFGVNPVVSTLLWQIDDRYRWKTIGGYGIVPNGSSSTIGIPPFQAPFPAYQFLVDWTVWASVPNVLGPPPRIDPTLVAQFRRYLQRDHVSVVVLDPTAVGARHALDLFKSELGPPRQAGGVDLWTGLDAARPH